MSWGSKQTTQATQNQNQTNTSTPLQQTYAAQLQQSLAPQYQQQIALANTPVYGDAQKAGVLQNLNDLANASIKHLGSTLASHGQMDSGSYASGASGIEQQRFGQASDFFNSLPALERQSHLQNVNAALNSANGYASSVPMGMSSTGASSSNSDSTTTTSPGLSGLVGALGGMAMSGLTGGLSSMMGGGGFTSGFGEGLGGYGGSGGYGGGSMPTPLAPLGMPPSYISNMPANSYPSSQARWF